MKTNGHATAAPQPRPPLTELREEYQRARLAEKTARAKMSARMAESMWQDDRDAFGGSDTFIRARVDGGAGWVPISVPSDRKHGAQWPLWRTEQELDRIRQAGRLLIGVNSFAKGLIRNLTNYVIGKGFGYKAASKELIDADPSKPGVQDPKAVKKLVRQLQDFIDQFLARNRWNANVDAKNDLLVAASTRERECYRRVQRDGETFLRFYQEADGSATVRFIEPECVRNPPGGTQQQGWFVGIRHQMDPYEDVETPEEYFVWHQDPSTVKGKLTAADASAVGELVPASEILHLKGPDTDADVARGISEFSFDVAKALERATKLQRNISEGAGYRAATAEIWKTSGATKAQVTTFGGEQQTGTYADPYTNEEVAFKRATPAGVRLIPETLEPVIPPADQSTAGYIEAETGDLRQAGSAFAAPEFWFCNASNSNYSSLETASAPPVKNGECEQEYYRSAFLAVVWKAVRWAVDMRLLPQQVLTLCDIQVEAPAVLHRDKLQKAQADQIAVASGWKSPQTCAMEDGLDHEIEAGNIVQWREKTGGGTPLPLPDEEGKLPGDDDGGQPPGGQPPANPFREAVEPVQIDLPDVRQSTDYSCGRAALQSVLRSLGIDDDLSGLGTDPVAGTRPGEIAAACRGLGLDVVAGSFAAVAGVRGLTRYVDRRIPVLCPIQADDPNGNSSGHWVVVCGYGGQNGAQLTLQDPIRGRVEMPATEFVRRWHDTDGDGRQYVRYGIAVSKPALHEDKAKGGQFKKGGGREAGGPGESPKGKDKKADGDKGKGGEKPAAKKDAAKDSGKASAKDKAPAAKANNKGAHSASGSGPDPDANRPSSPENRHKGATPEVKPYQEPPPKQGKKGGGQIERPKGDASQTALGDHTEALAAELGFRNILPEGKRTAAGTEDKRGSIDLEYDHSGKAYELKMCKTTSTEYRLKAKASEKEHKQAYAEKYKLTPYTLIGVRDVDKNEVHFYGSKQPGFTGAEVSDKHFDFLGTVKF